PLPWPPFPPPGSSPQGLSCASRAVLQSLFFPRPELRFLPPPAAGRTGAPGPGIPGTGPASRAGPSPGPLRFAPGSRVPLRRQEPSPQPAQARLPLRAASSVLHPRRRLFYRFFKRLLHRLFHRLFERLLGFVVRNHLLAVLLDRLLHRSLDGFAQRIQFLLELHLLRGFLMVLVRQLSFELLVLVRRPVAFKGLNQLRD